MERDDDNDICDWKENPEPIVQMLVRQPHGGAVAGDQHPINPSCASTSLGRTGPFPLW